MAKTTAVKNQQGQPVWVSGGAVAQDGSLKLYRCNRCQAEVVWAESKRTGKVYLANVYTGRADQRFYQKNALHRCDDSMKLADLMAAERAKQEATRVWTERVHELQIQLKAGEITRDELLKVMEAEAPA